MPDGNAFTPGARLAGAPIDPSALTSRIEHVIVLMLENRSFDHELGFLQHPHPDMFGQQDLASRFNMTDDQPAVQVPATADGTPNLVDPDHSPAGILEQMGPFGAVATMGGFVRNYNRRWPGKGGAVMKCLDPEQQCPVLAGLAKDFAVCTRWFSSVPGETWPNRNFAHAATSDRATQIEFGFYTDPTIFERLERQHRTWHIYYDGPPQVWFFKKLWQPRLRDLLPNRKGRLANWYGMARFYDHVLDGTLPTYSFIEPAHNHLFEDESAPRQTNSQHCTNNFNDDNAADFRAGDRLIGSIYDALVDNPDLFARTLLVITYDEHGGLFDHVEPPKAVAPGDPVEIGFVRTIGRLVRKVVDLVKKVPQTPTFNPTQLGPRVPAVLVSPWIRPGRVVPDVFDHASIPATLRACLAPDQAPLTGRDRCANTFHGVVADGQAVAGTVPRRLPDDDPPSPDDPPPLRWSSAYLPDDGGVAVDAAVTSTAPPPSPTDFDLRLASMGERVAKDLERSRRAGILRVEKAQARETEEDVPADAATVGSVAAGSPLEVFVDSARVTRSTGP